jgi:hypothetical protein
MEAQDAISPAERKEINSLKETVQTFITQHQTGKGDARKSVIAALRSFVSQDFENLNAAYDGIFAIITEETAKEYKKTPKMFGYLASLRGELKANKALYDTKKSAEEDVTRLQKQLKEIQDQQTSAAKQKEEAVAAPAAEEKTRRSRKNSRAKKPAETTFKQDSTVHLEQQLAEQKKRADEEKNRADEEKQRVQKLEQELKEKDRLLSGKNLDGAEHEKKFKMMEEEIQESNKAAKKYEARLKAQQEEAEKLRAEQDKKSKAELEATKEAAKSTIVEELKKAAAEVQQANKKATEASRAELAAHQKATEAEKSKFTEAKAAFQDGKDQGFDEGLVKGEKKATLEMVVFVEKVDKLHPELNLRKVFQETLALEGSNQTSSTSALVKFSEGRPNSSTHRPESHSNYSSTRQDSKPKIVITDKQTCIDILIQKRATLIGKSGGTTEEIRQNAIMPAAIEYFICDLILRGKDKSMVEIRAHADEYMQLISVGTCRSLAELVLDQDEKLTRQALTAEEANKYVKLLTENPFGFDAKRVTVILSDYANKKINLADAELRLKQCFIRSLVKPMIATWLGSKYTVVKALVDLYETLKKHEDKESQIIKRQIKLAVFILVARRDIQTAATIFTALQKMTDLRSGILKAIEPHINPNEKVSGTPLQPIDFEIFTALFARENAFFFPAETIANYFYAGGGTYEKDEHRKAAETTCLKILREELPEAKQQAPANTGVSSAMYKPEDSKKKAEVKPAPLTENPANNYAATSMDL